MDSILISTRFFVSKGTFFAVSNLQRDSTPRHTYISSVNRANPEKIITTIWVFWISMAHIYICYSPAGRSVLGEALPEVLSTARDRRPIRTDLGRWITFLIFVSGKVSFTLQPICVEVGRVHVDEGRDRLQTKTKHFNVILSSVILCYVTYCSLLE